MTGNCCKNIEINCIILCKSQTSLYCFSGWESQLKIIQVFVPEVFFSETDFIQKPAYLSHEVLKDIDARDGYHKMFLFIKTGQY